MVLLFRALVSKQKLSFDFFKFVSPCFRPVVIVGIDNYCDMAISVFRKTIIKIIITYHFEFSFWHRTPSVCMEFVEHRG